jgi:hypothetical protein
MSEDLNFSLPEKKTKNQRFNTTNVLLLILILLSIAVIIIISAKTSLSSGIDQVLSDSLQKDFAMKLQKHNLNKEAAVAWQQYLSTANIGKQEASNIWYTVGKLFQKAGLYERAIESYYRSELLYKNTDLENEISRRVQECYESLGNFAALRSELTERVGLNEDKDAIVLAEIGDMKINSVDLDQKIEEIIDLQLSQLAPLAKSEELKEQKEKLFKQLSGKDNRLNMLNQIISEELLYREARKRRIAEDQKFRSLLKNIERKMLAQNLLNQEMADKINITPSDLKNYYEANKGSYIKEGKQQLFEEVKNDVYMALRKEKEAELQNILFQKLKDEHNVVIHMQRIGQLYLQDQENKGNVKQKKK